METPPSGFQVGQGSSNVLLVDDDPRESNAVGHIDVMKLGSDSMNAIIQVDVIVDGEETAALMWRGENDEWINYKIICQISRAICGGRRHRRRKRLR